jgi:hypothetical protein
VAVVPGFGWGSRPSRTDFRAFIFRQGHRFENAVVAYLERSNKVRRMEGGPSWIRSDEACRETFEAMVCGEPIIHQAVLRNPENRTYGAPDLLVRSDVLGRLFPEAIPEDEASMGAPGLSARDWHYRVVDIKFSVLKLDRLGLAGGQHRAFMAQTFIYNEALGRIQGYTPPHSYLLGRGWRIGTRDEGCTSCLDRLGPVVHEGNIRGASLRSLATDAVEWMRRVRREGQDWDPRDEGCPPELRPTVSVRNQPWHGTIARLASEHEDLTLAWQVGLPGRERALTQGITRWTDPRFTANVAGVSGSRAVVLDRILAVNRDPEALAINPPRVTTAWHEWGEPREVEFFVDFETVSNLADDFQRIPEQNGQPLVFMIGCGHVEKGEWNFASFTAGALDVASEATIVEAWLAHMTAVRDRLGPDVRRPLVFHWSPAETATFTGLRSARARSPERSALWLEPNWFDFLDRVIRREPVIVRGPMGFGLKTFARSLKRHGLIETDWGESVSDGLGAMVAAWSCAEEAERRGCRLDQVDLMADVQAYNEVDCRVMMEAITSLRRSAARGEHSLALNPALI